MPHGFLRLGSVVEACPATLETKFVWRNLSSARHDPSTEKMQTSAAQPMRQTDASTVHLMVCSTTDKAERNMEAAGDSGCVDQLRIATSDPAYHGAQGGGSVEKMTLASGPLA